MASNHIKLDPETVEAVAQRVIELLPRGAAAPAELVDAAELARRLGVDRSWVYTHAIELGAIRLGEGPRPRLRFDPSLVAERIRQNARGQDTEAPRRRRQSPRQPRHVGERPSLLPIKGGAS
jgi:hypothetical protein